MSYADSIADAITEDVDTDTVSLDLSEDALATIGQAISRASKGKGTHQRMMGVYSALSLMPNVLKAEGFSGEAAKLRTFVKDLGKKMKGLEYDKRASEDIDIDAEELSEVRQGSQDVIKQLKKGGWVHVNVAGHTYELAKNKMGKVVTVRKQRGGRFGKAEQYMDIDKALSAIDLGDQSESHIIKSGTF